MTLLDQYLGVCYQARILGQGRYIDALDSMRAAINKVPGMREAAEKRLKEFQNIVDATTEGRDWAGAAHIKTLNDALGFNR